MPLLLLLALFADSHIHGIVRDSATRAPLHGATVRVVGLGKGAIADRNGAFHLHDLPSDTLHLDVAYVGYVTAHLRVATDKDVRIDVLLAQDTVVGNEIVVAAQRAGHDEMLTQPAVVLTAVEIDEHRGQTFADALSRISGVTLLQTGPSLKKPMIHGMTGSRLVLRNNNVVQEGQQWGLEHAPEIDAFSPNSITVIKGPASVMYGPNAIGGVIDLQPLPIRRVEGMHGEASVNMFSNGRQAAVGFYVDQSLGRGEPVARPNEQRTANSEQMVGSSEQRTANSEQIAYRLQGSVRKGGDASAPTYMINNTGVEELNGSLTVEAGNEHLGATAIGSVFTTKLGIFSGSHIGNAADLQRAIQRGQPENPKPFSYDITNPRQEISHGVLSVKGHLKTGQDERIVLTYGFQRNDRSEFDAHNTRIVGRGTDPVERARDSIARLQAALQTPAMNLLLSTSTLDGVFEHKLSENIRGSVGVASMWQLNERTGSVILIPDYRMWGLGAFAYESATFGDVTVSGGLRYDVRDLLALVLSHANNQVSRQTRRWENFTGSIGSRWRISPNVTALVNLSSAWRPPQVNELYSNDVHHGSAFYEIGDSTLRNEQTLGGDASLEVHQGILRFECSAYYHSIDGYIMAVPDVAHPTVTVRGTFPTYRYTQFPARIVGGDVNLTANVLESCNLYLSAAVVRGTDRLRNEPLQFMPADRARLGVHVHTDDVWGLHDAFIDVSSLGVRRQDNIVPGRDYAEPPAGYVRTDLSVGGVLELAENIMARVTLSCDNVFNIAYRDYLSQYRYFTNDPGRNIVLRFTTSF